MEFVIGIVVAIVSMVIWEMRRSLYKESTDILYQKEEDQNEIKNVINEKSIDELLRDANVSLKQRRLRDRKPPRE